MTHADLVARAARWLRTSQRCCVVLTERQAGIEIPDAIGWGRRGGSIVVECKASRSDFRADHLKPFRQHAFIGLGQQRFYLTPPGIVGTNELPDGWGLLEAHPRQLRMIRGATVQDFDRDREVRLLISEVSRYQIHGITYPPLPRPDADREAVQF